MTHEEIRLLSYLNDLHEINEDFLNQAGKAKYSELQDKQLSLAKG